MIGNVLKHSGPYGRRNLVFEGLGLLFLILLGFRLGFGADSGGFGA